MNNTSIQKTNAQDIILKSKKTFIKTYGGDETQFNIEANFAMQAIKKNPRLMSDPNGLLEAVKNVALTGLTLNPTINLAYLVPRGGKATLVPSFMGLIEILRNSGSILSMRAGVIYQGDEFDYDLGTNGYLKHKPQLSPAQNTPKLAAYAIAKMPDGSETFHLMGWNDIMKRKQVAASKNVWNQWEDEMAIKTVIRNFYKFLPKTPQANQAMSIIDSQQNQETETVEAVVEDQNI